MATSIFPETTTPAAPKTPRQISWPEFQRRYLNREDSYKYEWVDGIVLKTKRMDHTQLYILRNILAAFRALHFSGQVSGELLAESDIQFAGNHRRPDICYLTDEQIDRLAVSATDVPAFVIEIISTKDQFNAVQQKMNDYRRAGVTCVWLVLPIMQEVHIYHSENLRKVMVHTGDEVCSAAPALSVFEMTVEQVFYRANK